MYKYRVTNTIKVVDGDTLDLELDLGFNIFTRQRIRLYGVNTPESRTRNLEEKKKGLAAKAFVESWLVGYREDLVITTSKDKKGKFGRILGDIEAGGRSLVKDLIEKGYGKPYYGGKR